MAGRPRVPRTGDACIADAPHLHVSTLSLGGDRCADPAGRRDFADGAWVMQRLTTRFFDTL